MSLIIDSRCTIDHQPTGASASIQRSWKRASIELYTRSDGYVIKLIDLDAVNKDKKVPKLFSIAINLLVPFRNYYATY